MSSQLTIGVPMSCVTRTFFPPTARTPIYGVTITSAHYVIGQTPIILRCYKLWDATQGRDSKRFFRIDYWNNAAPALLLPLIVAIVDTRQVVNTRYIRGLYIYRIIEVYIAFKRVLYDSIFNIQINIKIFNIY